MLLIFFFFFIHRHHGSFRLCIYILYTLSLFAAPRPVDRHIFLFIYTYLACQLVRRGAQRKDQASSYAGWQAGRGLLYIFEFFLQPLELELISPLPVAGGSLFGTFIFYFGVTHTNHSISQPTTNPTRSFQRLLQLMF